MKPISPLIRIYTGFGILAIVLLWLSYFPFEFLRSYIHSWTDILILIIASQNIVTSHLIYKKTQDDKSLFPIFVIAAFIFRLLVAMLIMVLAWLLDIAEIEIFSINLITIYLVFLAFELYSLLTNLRPNSEEGVD